MEQQNALRVSKKTKSKILSLSIFSIFLYTDFLFFFVLPIRNAWIQIAEEDHVPN